jgi:orotidine-5'-phosphate decarboxylase
MTNAMDKLIAKVKKTDNPTVMGLDPRYDMIPECIRKKYTVDFEGACEAMLEFNKGLIDSVCDIIPAVKPQIAFYEMFGVEGINLFKKTCKYAKQRGMVVIADVKRGDIGTTAEGYSHAYLGKTELGELFYDIFDVDFVTLNPYLGTDSIKPFVEDCKKHGKGAFILVKTSNKSSGELQDLKLEDGKTVYEAVAELVNTWGEELIGENRIQQYWRSSWSNIPYPNRRTKKNNAKSILLNTRLWSTRWKSRRHSIRI